jgi:hypothetical protein
MKTFAQLTVGDAFFEVYDTQMKYTEKVVQMVDSSEIQFGYSYKIPRLSDRSGIIKTGSRYSGGASTYYFVSEADAKRFCKARMMKYLFSLVEQAKKSIQDIKDFRIEHSELLNHEWTERQINKLEKELAY